MKYLNLCILALLCLFISNRTFAQLQVDHAIELTGSGANAKITGIQNVTNTQDATNAGTIQSGSLIYSTSSGSSNSFILNITPFINSYQKGMVFNFIANQTVTGPSTLTIDNLGAVPIKKYINQDFTGCEIQTGQAVTVVYDGTNFQMTSIFGGATPTPSNAGPNQTNVSGTTATLQANNPSVGTGMWNIVSGNGGSLADAINPNTTFTGQVGGSYTLSWTISTTSCGSSTSNVTISFANIPSGCAKASDNTVWCVASDNNTTGADLCGYQAGYSGTYYAITQAGATALGKTITGYGDCATNYTEGASGLPNVIQGWNSSNCWSTHDEWARNGNNTGTNDFPVVRCTSYE